MKSYHLILFIILLFSSGCSNPNKQEIEEKKTTEAPLFNLVPSSESGIQFRNTLSEGPNTNILMYEYFYNGGGVAAGDINNDGLEDVYFSSNMGANKLYLNKGNFKFEDITNISGAGGNDGPWKTGVSMADVNGDGFLDIYLCYSGALPEGKRTNQLFINQGFNEDGIPTFKEEAKKYGIASDAYSNLGYFFDYDRDGDLDMILLNHNPKSLPVLNEFTTKQKINEDDPMIGLRLYRQDDGYFNDITPQAGISGSSLTYGLGVGISDVNDDGWLDFYVSNDYTIPDYLYINNQDGTFTDQLQDAIGHNSHFSMGNDIADINNDGKSDIFTLDMLPEDNKRQKLLLSPDNYPKFDLNLRSGFHYQYMRNMLQLNNGNNSFSEIGQMAGISNTDWSWSALFADYDNDGFKDLYITNGYYRDYTNLDFIAYMDDFVKQRGRLQREDVLELIQQMPASNVINYMYKNEGGTHFNKVTEDWGLSYPSNSNGAAFSDLDNDGDLDLIVNNINKEAFLFENKSDQKDNHFIALKLEAKDKNTHGVGTKVIVFTNEHILRSENIPTRGYLSSVSPILHFGIGNADKVDSIHLFWPDGNQEVVYEINSNQFIEITQGENREINVENKEIKNSVFSKTTGIIEYSDQQISKARDFDRQPLLIKEFSQHGPIIKFGNLDKDPNEEMIVSGSKGYPISIFNFNGEKWIKSSIKAFEETREFHVTDLELIDVDKDGDLDIYASSGGYHEFMPKDPAMQDQLYLNDGNGKYIIGTQNLPEIITNSTTVTALDINKDGFQDLFVGGGTVPGKYPEASPNYVLINNGNGQFTDETIEVAEDLAQLGIITDATSADLDNDGSEELIIVGRWMSVMIWKSESGYLKDISNQYIDNISGWWSVVSCHDMNNDGYPEILLGNVGENHQFKFSKEEPARMYFDDYDQNGSIDPIYTNFIIGKEYPYLTRDEALTQLVFLKSKFTNYESFANTTLSDLLSKDQIDKSQKYEANFMQSAVLWSNRDGQYNLKPLPKIAQTSPIYAFQPLDYNKDGIEDLLIFGNDATYKLRLGKMDANYGLLLEGTKENDFIPVAQFEAGLDVKGDIRSAKLFENILYIGIHGREMQTYKLRNKEVQ